MITKKLHSLLILDFDSTLISTEVLELLAVKKKKVAEISAITVKAMNGEMDFTEALNQRLHLLAIKRRDIVNIVEEINGYISASFLKQRDFIAENADNIYIVSGGFQEVIQPVAKRLGILSNHVYANTFIETAAGRGILTFDPNNPLAKQMGKVHAIQHIRNLHQINAKNYLEPYIDMIGDGYTDAQAKIYRVADRFFLYSEHVDRTALEPYADATITSFEQYIEAAVPAPFQLERAIPSPL